MTRVCAKSWGTLKTGWSFCSLDRGHAGPCACAGIPKPPEAKFFEEQPEAAAELERKRLKASE